MDPRSEVEAWKKGDLLAIVRDRENTNHSPAWWDGNPDPLDRILQDSFGHFVEDEFLLVIADDVRPWPGSPTYVGVDCIWKERKIWFLVDTDRTRDAFKRPFGYEVIKIR